MRRAVCVLVLLLAAGRAWAQDQDVLRFYIQSREASDVEHAVMRENVLAATVDADERTGIVADLWYPAHGVSAVAARMTLLQSERLDRQRFIVRLDPVMRPASGPLGGAWPLNQWQKPAATAAYGQTEPVVYVVDTGILSAHADFAYPPGQETLEFLPGFSFGYNYATMPPTLLPPYGDPHDHGTRVAGCLGGLGNGILGPLGGRAKVKSIVIYDEVGTPDPATYASQAIQGIFAAISDHVVRRSTPYLKNHASVLVFAHATSAASGRVADLDIAIESAWKEGLQVVIAAGNEGKPAADVSPAGAAWGYNLSGVETRFFFGTPPPGAKWFRAEEEFLVAGGFQENTPGMLALWPLSNINTPQADAIDLFAPAAAIKAPSALGLNLYAAGQGTSYAAAFVAGLAAWSAYECPWARPAQVRQAIRAASTGAFGFPKSETPALPASLSYRQWIDHYYPPASFGLAQRGPEADPDGDGVLNFVEYSHGGDPRFPDAGIEARIFLSPAAGASTVIVSMPHAGYLGTNPEVKWELQTTDDLKTWSAAPLLSYGVASPLALEGDGARWEAKASTVAAPPGAAFFRLRYHTSGPLL